MFAFFLSDSMMTCPLAMDRAKHNMESHLLVFGFGIGACLTVKPRSVLSSVHSLSLSDEWWKNIAHNRVTSMASSSMGAGGFGGVLVSSAHAWALEGPASRNHQDVCGAPFFMHLQVSGYELSPIGIVCHGPLRRRCMKHGIATACEFLLPGALGRAGDDVAAL